MLNLSSRVKNDLWILPRLAVSPALEGDVNTQQISDRDGTQLNQSNHRVSASHLKTPAVPIFPSSEVKLRLLLSRPLDVIRPCTLH